MKRLILFLCIFIGFVVPHKASDYSVKSYEEFQSPIVQMYVEGNAFTWVYQGTTQVRSKSLIEIRPACDNCTSFNIFYDGIVQKPRNIEFANIRDVNNTAFSSQSDFVQWTKNNLFFSAASGGSGAVRQEHIFTGADRAAAEAARDAYFVTNARELSEGLRIIITFATTAVEQVRVGTSWSDIGVSAVPDATTIKTSYESNADTNAFTDSEKTKLSNVKLYPSLTETTDALVSIKKIRSS